jgi:hypothetical protein
MAGTMASPSDAEMESWTAEQWQEWYQSQLRS